MRSHKSGQKSDNIENNKKHMKYEDVTFKCSCGCNSQVLVVEFPEGQVEINTRVDGRKRWMGVVLSKEDVKKLRKFLDNL